MLMRLCHHCRLPIRLHFGWCYSSGIKGPMPIEAASPNAIKFEPGELRQPKLGEWLAKNGRSKHG